MKCFQGLFTLVVMAPMFVACGDSTKNVGGSSPLTSIEIYKPSATDLRGTPMSLSSSSYDGKCLFRYMDGHNSSTCDATLTTSQSASSISLALEYKIDGKQSQLNPMVFAISNNLLYDSQRNIVGNIGSAALRFQGSDVGLMSVRQMPGGGVAVLVQQIPGMNGDSITNGFAFVSSMK